MLDAPPNNPDNIPLADWSQVFDGSKPNTAGVTNPAGSVNSEEDKPPESGKEDALKQQAAADMAANRGLREKYADKAYNLAAGCLSIWAVLLGVNGVVNAVQGREMWSDTVIIAVTTGVTVSVLAAFLGVIRGLFPGSAADKK
jgi:hypothetical protein